MSAASHFLEFFSLTLQLLRLACQESCKCCFFASCFYVRFLFHLLSSGPLRSPSSFNKNYINTYLSLVLNNSCPVLSVLLPLSYSVTMNLRVRDRERDKGADGMDAKNQQSLVRLIKINSFTLHSLRLFLFLFLIWRAQRVLSKCFLRKNRNTS